MKTSFMRRAGRLMVARLSIQLRRFRNIRDGSDPILYPNTDWAEVSLKDNAPQQRVNFQASGGSEKVRYMFSFGAVNQKGNYVNQPYNYKQYNARVRLMQIYQRT